MLDRSRSVAGNRACESVGRGTGALRERTYKHGADVCGADGTLGVVRCQVRNRHASIDREQDGG
jgi:hypothetical protein